MFRCPTRERCSGRCVSSSGRRSCCPPGVPRCSLAARIPQNDHLRAAVFEIDGLSWSVATRLRRADEVLDRLIEAVCRADAALPAADPGEPSRQRSPRQRRAGRGLRRRRAPGGPSARVHGGPRNPSRGPTLHTTVARVAKTSLPRVNRLRDSTETLEGTTYHLSVVEGRPGLVGPFQDFAHKQSSEASQGHSCTRSTRATGCRSGGFVRCVPAYTGPVAVRSLARKRRRWTGNRDH